MHGRILKKKKWTKFKDGTYENNQFLLVHESAAVPLVCVCVSVCVSRAEKGWAIELATMLTPHPPRLSTLIRWSFLLQCAKSPARDKDRLTDVPLISGPT